MRAASPCMSGPFVRRTSSCPWSCGVAPSPRLTATWPGRSCAISSGASMDTSPTSPPSAWRSARRGCAESPDGSDLGCPGRAPAADGDELSLKCLAGPVFIPGLAFELQTVVAIRARDEAGVLSRIDLLRVLDISEGTRGRIIRIDPYGCSGAWRRRSRVERPEAAECECSNDRAT